MTITLDTPTTEGLYRRHRQELLRYLGEHASVDPHTAEDIVQETFLRAWLTPNLATGPQESCRSWLFMVAGSLLFEPSYRRDLPWETTDAVLTELPQSRCAVERSVAALSLTSAIARLPRNQRDVVWLLFVQEHSHLDVAERLGIPLSTVASRAYTALRVLQGRLVAFDSGFKDTNPYWLPDVTRNAY